MKRRLGKSQNINDREKAKQAALLTAQEIYKIVSRNPKPFFQQEDGSDSSSTAHLPLESDTGFPLRSAIERGSSRGKNENPDIKSFTETVEGKTVASTPRRNGNKRRRNLVATRSPQLIKPKQKKMVEGSWMCPCCGAVFLHRELASKHEFNCIRTTFNFSAKASGSINERNEYHDDNAIENAIHLPHQMKMCMVMTDESLIKVAQTVSKYSLSAAQSDAERELVLKARDRAYYDFMANLSTETCSKVPSKKERSKGKLNFISKIQNKFSDAYTLIKEGGGDEQERVDQYDVRRGQQQGSNDFRHDSETTYINIVVKHSVLFVNNELERLAKERWFYEKKEYKNHFERIRTMAHVHAVRFAQLALAMDLKPSKVAVQLSNDLCRLFPAQLRRFGAEINTEIEYRKGAFFILSVNVLSIDWIILMKYFHKLAKKRKEAWAKSGSPDDSAEGKEHSITNITSIFSKYTLFEVIERCLCGLYYVHWVISVPFFFLVERLCSRTIKRFIITAVTDEFFQYVERKGMEMDLEVVSAQDQASFMLEALRQIRKNERDRNKRIKAEKGEEQEEITRGPLLGPAIDLDRDVVGPIPNDLIPPHDLETVCIQIDLPVGYLRLRKAFLHTPNFFSEAIFCDGLSYRDIKFEPWDKFDGIIGLDQKSIDVDEGEYIGAKQKCQYLMPRSVFVKENMAYEERELTSFNPFFFSLKKEITNPDVPYGKTFVTFSQISIFNSGNNSCRMVCSCEAKFPKGPPLVSRQILSAMRAGNQETSILLGETITKYAGIL